MNSSTLPRHAGRGLLFVGILLIATNLRAPVTALPPLLADLRADFALGTAAAGALTTLPLIAFGALSPVAPVLARRLGLERALLLALAAIALGIGLRSAGAAWALFLGTAVIGTGIAFGNVLLPSLVKRDFPEAVAATTSAYAFTMGAVAGLGSVLAIPLAHALGWRAALAALIVLPLAAAAAWLAQLGARTLPEGGSPPGARAPALWRCALAWQVTLFLGFNATIYYVAIGWLPTILAEDGYSPAQAGSLHGLLQIASAVAGPVLWLLLKRVRGHRALAAGCAGLSAIGLAGLEFAPAWAPFWAALFGLGTGAGIILGLTFVGLRTGGAGQAASLSGMAQCIGYLLAAAGPMAFGALHDALGGWHLPLDLCIALALATAWMGALAARPRTISRA